MSKQQQESEMYHYRSNDSCIYFSDMVPIERAYSFPKVIRVIMIILIYLSILYNYYFCGSNSLYKLYALFHLIMDKY